MAVERSELHLVWPAGLFAAEARALLAVGADDDALGGLLAEAFYGKRAELLLQVAGAQPHQAWTVEDPWASDNGGRAFDPEPFTSRATANLVAGLADDADTLPRHAPRLLLSQRHRTADPVAANSDQPKLVGSVAGSPVRARLPDDRDLEVLVEQTCVQVPDLLAE